MVFYKIHRLIWDSKREIGEQIRITSMTQRIMQERESNRLKRCQKTATTTTATFEPKTAANWKDANCSVNFCHSSYRPQLCILGGIAVYLASTSMSASTRLSSIVRRRRAVISNRTCCCSCFLAGLNLHLSPSTNHSIRRGNDNNCVPCKLMRDSATLEVNQVARAPPGASVPATNKSMAMQFHEFMSSTPQ